MFILFIPKRRRIVPKFQNISSNGQNMLIRFKFKFCIFFHYSHGQRCIQRRYCHRQCCRSRSCRDNLSKHGCTLTLSTKLQHLFLRLIKSYADTLQHIHLILHSLAHHVADAHGILIVAFRPFCWAMRLFMAGISVSRLCFSFRKVAICWAPLSYTSSPITPNSCCAEQNSLMLSTILSVAPIRCCMMV